VTYFPQTRQVSCEILASLDALCINACVPLLPIGSCCSNLKHDGDHFVSTIASLFNGEPHKLETWHGMVGGISN
jgi:hypothetical protein